MKDIFVIVPTYNPNTEITTKFIKELEKKVKDIIIVNDGCKDEFSDYFNTFKNHIVLTHHVNQGKGRALKTAFNYLLDQHPNFKGAVVADCDGQHSVEDILKVGEEVLNTPNKLILGVRNFNKDNVPKKSMFGNKITRNIFKLFIGLNITDTQTGLRGYSKELIPTFLKTKGERYEYETNMLIDCKEKDILIKEIKIKTIYINDNKTSHFNPVKDSIAIYKLFIKYILSALSSFIIDILLFTILLHFINNIMISTILSRIVSSIYNFYINKKLIFKKSSKNSLYKYFILVIVQMFLSGLLVTKLDGILNISTTLIKIIVDGIIFVINFIIQREWVFKKK